ncbi:RNA polymerase sigma factor [Alteromonas sediminis]|uniref:RNA polymerase sigma factor n=1 Tax=Alteromonas sediminis TaxID=2259342 RepID=A0A3N5XZD7_9ALTE|nr:RNA polymerase sigma factor [Alteromonas sediminis]RPJ66422.1 RNA polymerase sigma factor [Alteromonas sediminis]
MNTLAADVIEAKTGNLKAFERLINHTRNMVSSLALTIIKDVDASEEVAQLVYINCWQNLSSLKSENSFLPWVRQSTRYTALNYIRDNKLSKRIGGDEADELLASYCAQDQDPQEYYETDTMKKVVAQLVDNLPEETREVVLLYYREEMSSKQVAELLSISEAAVRKKLSRAREVLKQDALTKMGSAIYATAPAVTFTAMTLANLTMSAPASAATGGATATGLTKWSWLLSGAAIASAFAAVVVFLSARFPLKNMHSESKKKQLLKLRNLTIVWILLSGILLSTAYEFTKGAAAPISAFTVFSAGLYVLSRRSQLLIESDEGVKSRGRFWHANLSRACLILGIVAGYAGLFIGLINTGRLVL